MDWLGELATTGETPIPRKGHTMTRLLDSSIILVFAGEDTTGKLLSDMYSLDIERAKWTKIKYAAGPRPAGRLLHSATAISSTAMVIMYGDATADESQKGQSNPSKDVWLFDIRDCSWKEIKLQGGIIPPPRSCHSAVFGKPPGHPPAIYVFGGFGSTAGEGSSMYRLRIGDWRWECLPVVVKDTDGNEVVAENPASPKATSKAKDTGKKLYPAARESHGAIWLPNKSAMMIIGGDGGSAMLDDCWLFSPSSTKTGAWCWKQLKLKRAKGLGENKLPRSAGHTLIELPSDKNRVLMWGGITGPAGDDIMGAQYSYLIDLDAMQSTRMRASGKVPSMGRLLHGLVRMRDRLVAYGGCDGSGKVLDGVEAGRLPSKLISSEQAARDFGPEATALAEGEDVPMPQKKEFGDDVTEGVDPESEEDDPTHLPLVGPSPIPKGTPLSGRIIDATDFGYFVSVVIKNKAYKGVLVANPLKGAQSTLNSTQQADGNQNSSSRRDDAEGEPRQKRQKIDPNAAALPDSPQKRPKPMLGGEPTVIALD